jgi:hypothetical protein
VILSSRFARCANTRETINLVAGKSRADLDASRILSLAIVRLLEIVVLGRGPHGSGHWPRQGDRHKEVLGVQIIFPRLVHHPKQPVGSSIAVWNSPIQATHEK